MTIKNKNYLEFLSTGLMQTLDIDKIAQAIENINHRHKEEYKHFMVILYYTGARPVEILSLRQGDVWKEDHYIIFKMPAAKNGKSRLIYIADSRKFIIDTYRWCFNHFPRMLLFYNLIGNTSKYYKKKNGEIKKYIETTARLRYTFKKIFAPIIEGSISPYYIRHNTFSRLSMSGASLGDIKILKGGKTLRCAEYYIHMNTKKAKQIARINR